MLVVVFERDAALAIAFGSDLHFERRAFPRRRRRFGDALALRRLAEPAGVSRFGDGGVLRERLPEILEIEMRRLDVDF